MDPTNLENLSKEELLELLKKSQGKTAEGEKTDDNEKPYDPKSVMAMMMASPKEAKAIRREMLSPANNAGLYILIGIFLLGGLFVLIAAAGG